MNRCTLRGLVALCVLAVMSAACEPATEEAPAGGAAADTAPASAAAPSSDALIDPDQATVEQLTSIPAIDDSLAARIVAGRPYANMLEVDRVLAERLADEERDDVYRRLWKPLDLNTATTEEILMIPGVGPRMQHEFEEYRPYRAIEQFRREMGKYVDEAEVARLERYVTIRGADAPE